MKDEDDGKIVSLSDYKDQLESKDLYFIPDDVQDIICMKMSDRGIDFSCKFCQSLMHFWPLLNLSPSLTAEAEFSNELFRIFITIQCECCFNTAYFELCEYYDFDLLKERVKE